MPKVNLNDIDVYYESRGSGFPMVLIRGLGSNADQAFFYDQRTFDVFPVYRNEIGWCGDTVVGVGNPFPLV